MAIGRIPEPGTGIPESIVDAKGDIVTATAADTPARLAVGTNEHRLVADSAQATGLKYVADTTNYAIAAKGDLLVGTAADTLDKLSVGTNGHTLVADSSTATGLKWAAASSGALTKITSGSYSAASEVSIDSIFTGTYKRYQVILAFEGSGTNALRLRFRVSTTTQTAAEYYGGGSEIRRGNDTTTNGQAAATSRTIMPDINGAGNLINLYFTRVGNSSQLPAVFFGNYIGGSSQGSGTVAGIYNVSDNFTGINLTTSAGTFTGDYQVYGLEN